MNAYLSTVETPIGPFTSIVDADGAVLASGWTDDIELLRPVVHADLRGGDPVPRKDLGPVTAAVRAYHAGDLAAPDAIAVRQRSDGAFLTAAWKVLRELAPGNPVTYTELAARAGNPAASRAAGSACSRNAAALFVPCHRVVRIGGDVGGFRWGLAVKRWLLDHESPR